MAWVDMATLEYDPAQDTAAYRRAQKESRTMAQQVNVKPAQQMKAEDLPQNAGRPVERRDETAEIKAAAMAAELEALRAEKARLERENAALAAKVAAPSGATVVTGHTTQDGRFYLRVRLGGSYPYQQVISVPGDKGTAKHLSVLSTRLGDMLKAVQDCDPASVVFAPYVPPKGK